MKETIMLYQCKNTNNKILSFMFLTVLIMVSCTSRYLVTAVKPVSTKAQIRNRIKVMLKLSSNSLLKNRVAVINRSTVEVAVYPVDITLQIPELNFTLPAVMDYRGYVTMRYEEGSKKCDENGSVTDCKKTVEKYFKRFLHVKTFQFGEIPSQKRSIGYFAFNLPDPLNITDDARNASKIILDADQSTHDGIITVAVSSIALEPQKTIFVFPVKVISSTDKTKKLLRIQKIFSDS